MAHADDQMTSSASLFRWRVEPGQKYPLVNRVLNGVFMSALVIVFFGWWLVLCIGFVAWVGGLWTQFLWLLGAAALSIAVATIVKDDRKPFPMRPGAYVPGSAPNPHPYQSIEWYAHESLMEQQRAARQGQ